MSCSDIEILATRDAVRLAGGNAYAVRTGRRDGRQSKADDVKLPGPESTVSQATAFFGKLGLSQMDMVLLLGAHTVGVTHCSVIKSTRLYNYGGKSGATDPSLGGGGEGHGTSHRHGLRGAAYANQVVHASERVSECGR